MEALSGGGRMAATRFVCSSSASVGSSTTCFLPGARQAPFFAAWSRLPVRPPMVVSHARHSKKKSSFEAVLKQPVSQEVEREDEVVTEDDEEEGDGDFVDELEDDMLVNEDVDFEEEFELDDAEPYVGDGASGGGVSLAGTWWDKEALAIAEDVSKAFNGDLKIYAFKTSANSVIRMRIEKLSSKYGSPCMTDIEEFSSAYRARLDEAENAGTLPQNLSLEVSSPGVERVVRIPEDLERFKDRPMYVKYLREVAETDLSQEGDGVLKLITFNMESGYCIWGLADVRVNREKTGKGRPLSKKQREWRLQTPFDSLLLVRLYSEC